MSAMDLGALAAARIELTTNISQFAADLAKAKAELGTVEQAGKKTESTLMHVFTSAKSSAAGFIESITSMKGMLVELGAVLALGGLTSMIKGSLEAASQLKNLAAETGLSIERIQSLQYRSMQFGITMDQVNNGLLMFNRNYGMFLNDQSGPGAKAFTDLGVKAALLKGQIHGAGEAFDVFEKHLRNVSNISQAAAYSSEVFGRQLGPRFAAVVRQSSDAVAKLNAEGEKTGFIMKADMVEAAARANEKLNILWETMKRDFTSQIARLAPEIETIAKDITDGLPDLIKWVDKWAVWFGLIDRNSASGLKVQIDEVTASIQSLQKQKAESAKSSASGIIGLESIFGLGTSQDDFDILIKAEQDKLAKLQAKLAKAPKPVEAPSTTPKPPPDVLGAKAGEADEMAKLVKEWTEQAIDEIKHVGEMQDKMQAAGDAARDAEAKSLTELTKQQGESNIAAATLTNNKIKLFDAQAAAARNDADAEIAAAKAEQQAQLDALNKINDEYKKLYEGDLPGYLEAIQRVNQETANKIATAHMKSVTQMNQIDHERQTYLDQANQEMVQSYSNAIDDMFGALDGFLEHGGNIFQALNDSARQAAAGILKTFIELSVQNPLKNSLFGGTLNWQPLPTIGNAFGGAAPGMNNPNGTSTNPFYVTLVGANGQSLGVLSGMGGDNSDGFLGNLFGGGQESGTGGLFGGGGFFGSGGFMDSLFGGTSAGESTVGISSAFADSAVAADAASSVGDLGFLADLAPLLFLADGGPVKSGDAYMVGEEGPELFVSDRNGSIVPNDQLGAVGSQGGDTFHLNFNGPTDASSILRSRSQIEAMVTRASARGKRNT